MAKKEANLLVTYDPSHPGKAKAEVEAVMKEVKAKSEFLKSEIGGLFQLRVAKPKEVVKKLRGVCGKKSELFEATFHYIPIDEWCSSGLKKMQSVVGKLGKKIGNNEKWKMNLNKRQYEGDSRELIIKLTDPIDKKKVDLSSPEKIVQVEIVGKRAGIALLKSSELLEVPKIKG